MEPRELWRLTSTKQRLYRSKDAFIVSVPKSGRTWLRVLLHAYYGAFHGSSEEPNSRDVYTDGRPAYHFTHDRYSHLTIANRWHRLLGRYLIPAERRRNGRIVLLARDPRDLMVSLYFQNTKRVKGNQAFHGTISDMLKDPVYGVDQVVRVMNDWLAEWGGDRERFLLCRYEDMHATPEQTFGQVIRFLGSTPADDRALAHAIEHSRFDSMQARERASATGPSALRPGDPDDPESFKARKGKVGGYREYLDDTDVAVIEQAMQRLDPRFGYTPCRNE